MNFDDLQHPKPFSGATYLPEQFGNQLAKSVNKDVEKADIVIVGIADDRRGKGGGSSESPDIIRKALFELYQPASKVALADIGNIPAGKTVAETYEHVASVVKQLVANKIAVVLIGGSQNFTYAQYKGYSDLEHFVNLGIMDKKIELSQREEGKAVSAQSYINDIIRSKPNYLFNLLHMGHQNYLTGSHVIQAMHSLHFELQRLGEMRANINETEIYVRDLDALSVSMDVLKSADLPMSPNNSPNGLYSEELAQVFRYAGMSDKLSSIGLFDYNPLYDQNGVGARLAAQLIYCFIEGYSLRKNDWPKHDSPEFYRYTVHSADKDRELIFLKSRATSRWWMEMPIEKATRSKKYFVPCSYKDYTTALKGDIPIRWLQAYAKYR